MITKKLCPLMSYRILEENAGDIACFGEKCQLWVKVVKIGALQDLKFEGCGLISHIPWKVDKDEKSNSDDDKTL